MDHLTDEQFIDAIIAKVYAPTDVKLAEMQVMIDEVEATLDARNFLTKCQFEVGK